VIVLDASPLIAYFDGADALHERAVASLQRLGGRRLAISPVTLAEVLVGPTRNGALDVILTGLEILQVEEIGLPDDAAVRLASLRATTRLRLPDCCVLLAAQQGAAAVLTFDDRLAAVSERLGVPLAT
jgi:predicted nucleic acid-binding protein